ncbi:MAG: DUF4407 domain-containing protein [Saprospiraceae bacterium]
MEKEISMLFQILGFALFFLLVLFGLGRISDKVRYFFWFCSGVNIPLLKKCPNDYNRYSNIGATIFFTALLAWVSMGYALNSVFNSLPPSVLFGFIWAMMIFTLDRTIVSSMQKPSQEVTYKQFEYWRETLFAAIRLIVAVIISLVIMKPLEIKIFEDRLAAEIKNMDDDQAKLDSVAIERKYGVGDLTKVIDQARADKDELEGKLGQEPPTEVYKNLKDDYQVCNQKLTQVRAKNAPQIKQNNIAIERVRREFTVQMEINGEMKWRLNSEGENKIKDLNWAIRQLNNEIAAQGRECNNISNEMRNEREKYQNQIQQDLAATRERISKNEIEKDSAKVKATIQAKSDTEIRAMSFKGTLVTQIEALGRLTAKDTTMRLVSLFIMLIFIAIETAPILAKLIAKRGDYDEILDMEKHKIWVRQQYAKSKINSEINRGLEELKIIDDKARKLVQAREQVFVQMSSSKLKSQLQKELENNEALLSMISEAQKEIAAEVVRQWKEQELEKLKNQNKST